MSILITARTLLPIIVSFTLLGHAASAQPLGVYQENFSAHFSLKTRGTLVGKTEWSLINKNGNEFVYKSQSKAVGIARLITNDHVVESSIWKRQKQGLVPHTYQYNRSGGKKEKQVTVEFDWTKSVARNTAKGKTWTMSIPEGTLDKLSYIIVMMYDLNAGRRDLQYQIADGGKLKLYHFKVIGEESLETIFGNLATLVIKRIRDDKRQTTYWCAPGYSYLPVKVEHREKDGAVITLLIESVQGIPAI